MHVRTVLSNKNFVKWLFKQSVAIKKTLQSPRYQNVHIKGVDLLDIWISNFYGMNEFVRLKQLNDIAHIRNNVVFY